MTALDVNQYIEKGLVHSIHTTGRRSFRGCRRRWDWIFRQYYYPVVTPRPLEFGVAFHKAMEALYNPETWHDREVALALAIVAFKKKTEEQFEKFRQYNGGNVWPEHEQDYKERVELGIGMLKHYAKHVMPLYDSHIKPLKVEIPFEVPIPRPEVYARNGYQSGAGLNAQPDDVLWCKCDACFKRWMASEEGKAAWAYCKRMHVNSCGEGPEDSYKDLDWRGLPVTYGGRIDAIVVDLLDRQWVVDWKTAARLSTGDPGASDDYMWNDDQITSYCWAMWTLGIDIAGFIYAEIKKAIPVEPEPNKTQRLGRWYSVNKQLDTTYEMYLKTVSENDPQAYEAGLYDDFLGYLRNDGTRFHLRHEIPRNEYELAQAGINIWNEACDMTDPDLRIYPSSGRFNCTNCAFWEPCLGKNRGEDYEYSLESNFEQRVRHYWEQEPTTEKYGRS